MAAAICVREDVHSEEMTVLIADDSDAIVRRLVGLLADVDGLEVIGRAGTVPEVSRAVQTLKPDVVILDLQMPGGSGIDVLEGLKQDGAGPVVIVLTNHAGPQYRKKCLKSGARFFMDKSTEFERVGTVLSGLIRESDLTA
jgi:DNA-binding NarL/FixJ family response regulator